MGAFGQSIIIFTLIAIQSALATFEPCESALVGRFRDETGRIKSSVTSTMFTPSLNNWWLSTRFTLSPEVRQVLEDGRELTSSEAYARADERGRLVVLLRFVSARMAWDQQTACEPPERFDTIIVTGRGSCQHFSMLYAAIASEAGLPVKFVRHYPEDGSSSHVWLEVGRYVVDPAFNYVKSLSRVIALARSDVGSMEAQFYAHRERIYDDVF